MVVSGVVGEAKDACEGPWIYARMPYVFVRESVYACWTSVQGISFSEFRQLVEKVGEQPEVYNEREKKAEFSLPSWMVLNGMEFLGYRVVTSGQYITGNERHDQREFVWTMHKTREEWDLNT